MHKSYEAANGIVEESITFNVKANHEYVLIIYYHGELTYD
jgi:hypothetical protein